MPIYGRLAKEHTMNADEKIRRMLTGIVKSRQQEAKRQQDDAIRAAKKEVVVMPKMNPHDDRNPN
jgi:hypothetical protein